MMGKRNISGSRGLAYSIAWVVCFSLNLIPNDWLRCSSLGCASFRRMLVEWAEVNGERGAIVHQCDYLKVFPDPFVAVCEKIVTISQSRR